VRAHVEAALAAGIRGVFGWVGPELCIPPLMPPAAFERYVFAVDKPLVDRIHDAGGRVWVHCHGRMKPVLKRFADMGIDVLNPIEPPPMGDITLPEAFEAVGGRMGLEGNIETHDFMTAPKDVIREKVRAALDAGRGRRFILCPSSGYMENVTPSPREIENWLCYIEEGVRYAEGLRSG
jgi:uroporphyrinogen-III decarboxylase